MYKIFKFPFSSISVLFPPSLKVSFTLNFNGMIVYGFVFEIYFFIYHFFFEENIGVFHSF